MRKSPSAVPELPDWGLSALDPILGSAQKGPVGIAVSGGSDSLALLLLASGWAQKSDREIRAATVDHQLRPESRSEAQTVSELCAKLGVPHEILTWQSKPTGNLQAVARDARRALLGEWAGRHGISAVALGHTQDDQAETLMLRLMRGSGVDGLAAMRPISGSDPLWLRPLLGISRSRLQAWLTAKGVEWFEDPSNRDDRFDRVRVRQAIGTLGLDREGLALTADRMALARDVLDDAAVELARLSSEETVFGTVEMKTDTLMNAREETALRVLAGALCHVSGNVYRPRFARLREILDMIRFGLAGEGQSLHGCLLRPKGDLLSIRREPNAVAGPVPAGQVWDGRWRTLANDEELTVSALGDAGLDSIPNWREVRQPREILITTPAFRKNECLVAAPCVKPVPGCHASLTKSFEYLSVALSPR